MRCSSRLGACSAAAAHARGGCSGREATRAQAVHHPASDDSLSSLRALSHFSASVSGSTVGTPAQRSRRPLHIVSQSIFDPPPFNPAQLTVRFATGACTLRPGPPAPRRYTLTHNDITGALSLTIGQEYNTKQISGFYTRLLRDEIVAEWHHDGGGPPALHLYCHVSGEERWLASPQLRDYIFRRELPLVLDTVLHADQQYLREFSNLKSAFVYVHFHSHVPELNQLECWGTLGDRSSWPKIPKSILQRAWLSVIGLAQLAPAQPDEAARTQLQRPARVPLPLPPRAGMSAVAAAAPSGSPGAGGGRAAQQLPQRQPTSAAGSNGAAAAVSAGASPAKPVAAVAAGGAESDGEAAQQPDLGTVADWPALPDGEAAQQPDMDMVADWRVVSEGEAAQQPDAAGGRGVVVYQHHSWH